MQHRYNPNLNSLVYPCSHVTTCLALSLATRAVQRVNQLESRRAASNEGRLNERRQREQHMQQTAGSLPARSLSRSHRGSDVWALIIFEGGNWVEFRKVSLQVRAPIYRVFHG